MYSRILLLTILLLSCVPVAAQFGSNGSDYINETLNLDPQAIQMIIATGDAAGRDIRWLTLEEKTRKYNLTLKQAEAKQQERELQRAQLAELADGLRRTGELFRSYYEKFQLVSNAVQTVSGFLKIGKRIRSIIEIIDRLRVLFAGMDQFSARERDVIAKTLTAMIERTEGVLKAANFALLGDNTAAEELDELREEHGNFMVLMRSIDRTEQLDLLDQEISVILSDLQRLVVFLTNIQNNRKNAVSEPDILRSLLSGN